MKIKVQQCWNGHRLLFRAVVCGGLRVHSDKWNRHTAKEMLDLLEVELPDVRRQNIRFVHV